jgi:hypothetical protein
MKIKLMTGLHGRPGQGAALLYGGARVCKEDGLSQGPYRWLTLASAEQTDGAELHLERNDNLAAKAFQQARLQQGQPAAMF